MSAVVVWGLAEKSRMYGTWLLSMRDYCTGLYKFYKLFLPPRGIADLARVVLKFKALIPSCYVLLLNRCIISSTESVFVKGNMLLS